MQCNMTMRWMASQCTRAGFLVFQRRCIAGKTGHARYSKDDMEAFTTAVFSGLDMTKEHATLVAKCLVESNLRGQDGHGVSRIPVYAKRIRSGVVNPLPHISTNKVATAAALVSGDGGMGFIAASHAMDEAIRICKDHGIGLVGVRDSTHFGANAHYVLQALEEDMISIVLTNSSPALPPWGGTKAFLGASPIAAGAPAGTEHHFLLDMSTTVVARGKLRLAAQRNERIPEGIGLDKHGKPTTDGMEAFHGVTLPFGGYKGAALSVMMDVFAGVLTGAAFGGNVASLYNDFTNKQNVGHFVVAIKPDLFMPMSEFKGRMDDLVRRIKQQPLAEGFDEILMVGEPESRSAQERIKHGIPIQNDVIGLLKAEADKLGISFPHPIDNT